MILMADSYSYLRIFDKATKSLSNGMTKANGIAVLYLSMMSKGSMSARICSKKENITL